MTILQKIVDVFTAPVSSPTESSYEGGNCPHCGLRLREIGLKKGDEVVRASKSCGWCGWSDEDTEPDRSRAEAHRRRRAALQAALGYFYAQRRRR
jgi:hypothetical protein